MKKAKLAELENKQNMVLTKHETLFKTFNNYFPTKLRAMLGVRNYAKFVYGFDLVDWFVYAEIEGYFALAFQ